MKNKFSVSFGLYKEVDIVLSSLNTFPIDYHVMISLKSNEGNDVIFTDVIE